ncbi:MAG: biotin--[acetyl-CoA-carboxylase] ligase [Rickettsiales bacterium]|jgi:BirA family biotin operon repressor/biotin-[acetyl-CoA-carboxylase] ligase|nr:biotin--[acetyl-CoA-carboxylase] ligase [Rickettsiales bacterium]
MLLKQEKYLNYNILEFDILDTTINKIKEFPINTIVVANSQMNGKGKGDRVWISDDSGNLYFSMSLKIDKNLDYSQVSFIASIAMRENIKNSVSKWPNDILINNKKCCGILLTNDVNLIVSAGVNINTYPINNTNFKATSLKEYGIIIDKIDLLKKFLSAFNYYYNIWIEHGFAIIRSKWLEKCYNLNSKISINDREGIFLDIDINGNLLFKIDGEIQKISSGDIF